MSEAATSNENVVQPTSFANDGESAPAHESSEVPHVSPATERARPSSGTERPPSTQPAVHGGTGQPDSASNEAFLQFLQVLTREFLGITPQSTTSNYDEEIKVLRKRLFGLTKGLSKPAGSNNRFDYEQKYPEDKPGEETAPNARVWLTYLDEAETYDRERVEGWKETVDVLLVFAGLFSGVITTFISQASQSLQQDNTRVSASLLFEATQLLRAGFSGTSVNNIPMSTLTPTSLFTPSTNAFLVNGLWFTSLAITLSTALFAVLAKQWLYYYMSSITGTPREKVRARQLRFQGFESWKVGAIIDLLPILLHLAVGIFLTGIIILLFPLDFRVACAIIAITGLTYVLYFVSVILPIRHPECPYTTSLTIYIGVLFFFLPKILHWIWAVSKKTLSTNPETSSKQVQQPDSETSPDKASRPETSSKWRRISLFLNPIWCLLQYLRAQVRRVFDAVMDSDTLNTLVDFTGRVYKVCRRFTSTIPKFTNWREEKIKKAIANVTSLDLEALYWLYKTSSTTSVHRIIARCLFMHRNLTQRFELDILDNLWRTVEVNETKVAVDLRHGLCSDLLSEECNYWTLLRTNPYVEASQPEKAGYQSYSRIAENVLNHNYNQILKDALSDDTLEFPLAMWHCFLAKAPGDATVVEHILIPHGCNLFDWRSDSTYESTHPISFETVLGAGGEPRKWIFSYLFRYFCDSARPDYSSDDKSFETRYLLFVSVYRNLTSDQPFIADGGRRQDSLYWLFGNFYDWLFSEPRSLSPKQYLAFFREICCEDVFWSESMTDEARQLAAVCLDQIWALMDTDVANFLPFTEPDDFSFVYQWCSRDLGIGLSWRTTPIFSLLFMPQNRDRLCTILSNDPTAGVSRFSNCLQNSGGWYGSYRRKHILIDLFNSMRPDAVVFTVLFNPAVLVQAWKLLVTYGLGEKEFLLIVKSKLDPVDPEKLNDVYGLMNEEAQSTRYKRDAFVTSARKFGRLVGVSHSTHNSTTDYHAAESGAERDHDAEERGQGHNENEQEGPQSIVHRIKNVFVYSTEDRIDR